MKAAFPKYCAVPLRKKINDSGESKKLLRDNSPTSPKAYRQATFDAYVKPYREEGATFEALFPGEVEDPTIGYLDMQKLKAERDAKSPPKKTPECVETSVVPSTQCIQKPSLSFYKEPKLSPTKVSDIDYGFEPIPVPSQECSSSTRPETNSPSSGQTDSGSSSVKSSLVFTKQLSSSSNSFQLTGQGIISLAEKLKTDEPSFSSIVDVYLHLRKKELQLKLMPSSNTIEEAKIIYESLKKGNVVNVIALILKYGENFQFDYINKNVGELRASSPSLVKTSYENIKYLNFVNHITQINRYLLRIDFAKLIMISEQNPIIFNTNLSPINFESKRFLFKEGHDYIISQKDFLNQLIIDLNRQHYDAFEFKLDYLNRLDFKPVFKSIDPVRVLPQGILVK